MNECPNCHQIQCFCQQVDLEKGEVIGYLCNQCGYELWEEKYIEKIEGKAV